MAQTLEELIQMELGHLLVQLHSKEAKLQAANEIIAAQRAELIKWRPDPKPTFPEGNK